MVGIGSIVFFLAVVKNRVAPMRRTVTSVCCDVQIGFPVPQFSRHRRFV
jgi:hypothetical protein